MRLPIILDTDPGIDDAAAIAAALFAPELDLQLMTTVAGNVSVEKTTRNALQLLHFWNADVPLTGARRCRWFALCATPPRCTASPVWKATISLNITASRWRNRRFRRSATR